MLTQQLVGGGLEEAGRRATDDAVRHRSRRNGERRRSAEARHAVLKEGALTLEDYWMRRSARARFDLDGGLARCRPAADAMAPLLGWSEAEADRQIEACVALREMERAPLGAAAERR